MKKVLGLCADRHEIPGISYIFDADYFNGSNMFDYKRMNKTIHEKCRNAGELVIYVTGYTPALVEVINYCMRNLIKLTLMHYNRVTNSYIEQETDTMIWVPELKDGGYYPGTYIES